MNEITISRLNKISLLLDERNSVHLKELASLLGVSEITVRRNVLESNAGLKIVGGYVIKDDSSSHGDILGESKRDEYLQTSGYSLILELHKRVKEKRHIGQVASETIIDGDIVFIDGGSTAQFIAEFIPKDLFCTVVCYSFNTLTILKQRPNCEIIILGGGYNRKNQNFCGINPDIILSDIRISKSFISCAGMTYSFGVMDSDQDSIAIKKKVMSISQKSYLIADTSKIERVGTTHFADFSQFDALITNRYSFGDERIESLQKLGLQILS